MPFKRKEKKKTKTKKPVQPTHHDTWWGLKKCSHGDILGPEFPSGEQGSIKFHQL